MSELPAGTVTFLFTDMEGSTRLLSTLGREHYGEVLKRAIIYLSRLRGAPGHRGRHAGRRVLRRLSHGRRRRGRGSGGAASARRPRVAGGRGGTRAYGPAQAARGAGGEPVRRRRRPPRAGRVQSAAHGGQVLYLQLHARAGGGAAAPADVVVLRDLGLQQLKDLDRPERVYQLEAEGLQRAVPADSRGSHPRRRDCAAGCRARAGGPRAPPRSRHSRSSLRSSRGSAHGRRRQPLAAENGGRLWQPSSPGSAEVDATASRREPHRRRWRWAREPSGCSAPTTGRSHASDPSSGERVPFTTSATPLDLATGCRLALGRDRMRQARGDADHQSREMTRASPRVAPGTRAERRGDHASSRRGRGLEPRPAARRRRRRLRLGHRCGLRHLSASIASRATDRYVRSSSQRRRSRPGGNEVWASAGGGVGRAARPEERQGHRGASRLPATALDGLAIGEGAVWATADADGALWRIDLAGGRPSSISVGRRCGRGERRRRVGLGGQSAARHGERGEPGLECRRAHDRRRRHAARARDRRGRSVGRGQRERRNGGCPEGEHEGLPARSASRCSSGARARPTSWSPPTWRSRAATGSQTSRWPRRSRTRSRARLQGGAVPHRLSVLRRLARPHRSLRSRQVRQERPHLRGGEEGLGVIGTFNSPCALEEVPILNQAPGGGLAMISPTNSAIGLTRYGPGVPPGTLARAVPERPAELFRVATTDDYQGAGLALLAQAAGRPARGGAARRRPLLLETARRQLPHRRRRSRRPLDERAGAGTQCSELPLARRSGSRGSGRRRSCSPGSSMRTGGRS